MQSANSSEGRRHKAIHPRHNSTTTSCWLNVWFLFEVISNVYPSLKTPPSLTSCLTIMLGWETYSYRGPSLAWFLVVCHKWTKQEIKSCSYLPAVRTHIQSVLHWMNALLEFKKGNYFLQKLRMWISDNAFLSLTVWVSHSHSVFLLKSFFAPQFPLHAVESVVIGDAMK